MYKRCRINEEVRGEPLKLQRFPSEILVCVRYRKTRDAAAYIVFFRAVHRSRKQSSAADKEKAAERKEVKNEHIL